METLKRIQVRTVPAPLSVETPAEFAARLGSWYAGDVALDQRRELGQFFTPLEVARFMAKLASPSPSVRHLLDPCAGTGVLACALGEALPPGCGPIGLVCYEIDPGLAALCRVALQFAAQWLVERGILLTFEVRNTDFVMENAASLTPGLFDLGSPEKVDIAIANPPYFKLQKRDPRAAAVSGVVHGQPNIYAIFMAVTASLLKPGGVMVTITPRSFAAGGYFKQFRRHLFTGLTPEAVHLFHSRKEAFRDDSVLQENVILKARKVRPSSTAMVAVGTSQGLSDLPESTVRHVAVASIVDTDSSDAIFSIPIDKIDEDIVAFVKAWPNTLHKFGLQVSTGPVVAFRARAHLLTSVDGEESCSPLLWLQNVRQMAICWPMAGSGKPQYIRVGAESHALLVRNATCVLMRRFAAKEEHRRLVAAPVLAGQFPGKFLGLENHLNYLHRPGGDLTTLEAVGLAAMLGSGLIDRYFRVSNGNTQVNAAELRALPIPAHGTLEALGALIRRGQLEGTSVEEAVTEVLNIPKPIADAIRAGAHGQS